MNYLEIKMNKKNKNLIYNGKLILGDKMDHNIFSLKFDIPQNFEQLNKFVLLYNKEHNIKLSYRLDEKNSMRISSNITKNPITYKILLIMCKTAELEDEENIVCISSSIEGTVRDNDLDVEDVEDDTDPIIIYVDSDMNTINNNLKSISANIVSIKEDLVENIIDSNKETQNIVKQIFEKLNELSASIVDSLEVKIDAIIEKINDYKLETKNAIDRNNEEILQNRTLNTTNKENIVEKVEEVKTGIIENVDRNDNDILQNRSENIEHREKIIEKIGELETANNLTYDVLDDVNNTIKNKILCNGGA